MVKPKGNRRTDTPLTGSAKRSCWYSSSKLPCHVKRSPTPISAICSMSTPSRWTRTLHHDPLPTALESRGCRWSLARVFRLCHPTAVRGSSLFAFVFHVLDFGIGTPFCASKRWSFFIGKKSEAHTNLSQGLQGLAITTSSTPCAFKSSWKVPNRKSKDL